MSRSARSPALSVIGSPAASVSTCRQSCCSRRRLSCSCLARTCWCCCSFSSSAATARSSRSAGLRVGRRVLAQHVGVAPQAAPARDDLLERLLGGQQLLELGRQRLEPADRGLGQHAPALAILERAAGILEPARQRRRVLRRHRRQRVPAHLAARRCDPARRRRRAASICLARWPGGRPARAPAPRRAPARPRAPARARRSPRARHRWRASNCCVSAVVDLDVGLQLGPRQPHLRQRARRFVGIGDRHQRLGLVQQRRARAARSSALIAPPAARRAGCAASSSWRSLVRARRAATLLRARCAIARQRLGVARCARARPRRRRCARP